jgi:futalosine hydrolase
LILVDVFIRVARFLYIRKMIRKILIVSATGAEIKGLMSSDSPIPAAGIPFLIPGDDAPDVYGLITGVGSVATAFHMANVLAFNTYDVVLNIGLAGAFNRNLSLGDVLEVNSDCFADLGAVDHERFLSLIDLGLMSSDEFPYTNGQLVPPPVNGLPTGLKRASSITVNSVHGDVRGIEAVQKQFPADLESMEGAAFFYAALFKGIPCVQIRAVSNYVEPRNRDAWEIKLALSNLWDAVRMIIGNC